MPSRPRRLIGAALACFLAWGIAGASPAASGEFATLHSFADATGASPMGALAGSASTALYGTTFYGGTLNKGTVFALARDAGGKWKLEVLHSFSGRRGDGAYPQAGLVLGTDGALYGTTTAGGGASACTGGCGTVFRVAPKAGGGWTTKTLHTFMSGADGAEPRAGVIFGEGGLYGTTYAGGSENAGVIFRLSRGAGDTWREAILHTFDGADDGGKPDASLTLGSDGVTLYGTATQGGVTKGQCSQDFRGCGTVYALKQSAAAWDFSVIHRFAEKRDGMEPAGPLALGPGGTLYGATHRGGRNNTGTVFSLTPPAAGAVSWTEALVHQFGSGRTGKDPQGIVFANGVLLGVTQFGGGGLGYGTVFRLDPDGAGGWGLTVIHDFKGAKDGNYPQATLVQSGPNFEGVTSEGGRFDRGTIFALQP